MPVLGGESYNSSQSDKMHNSLAEKQQLEVYFIYTK